MGLFVTLAMKPTMEKMTKPANMLVKEFMQQTMTESLYERDKTKRQPLSRWYQFLISQSHIVAWGGGSGHFVYCSSAEAVQNYVDWYSGAGGTVIKIAGIRDKHDGAVHRLTQTSNSANIRKKNWHSWNHKCTIKTQKWNPLILTSFKRYALSDDIVSWRSSRSPTCTRYYWRYCSCQERSVNLIPAHRRRKSV